MNDKAMREALERIKALVVGPRYPRWDRDDQVTHMRGMIADLCDSALAAPAQSDAKPIYLVENGNKTFDIVDEYWYNDWPCKKRILYDAPVQSEAGHIGWVDPYTFKKMCEDVSGALRYVTKSPSDGDIPLFSGCEPHAPRGTDAPAVQRLEALVGSWEHFGVGKTVAEVQMDYQSSVALSIDDMREILKIAKRGES